MSTAHTSIADSSPTPFALNQRWGLGAAAAAAALLSAALVIGNAEGYAVAGCRVAPSLPRIGVEADTTMEVSRGTSCAIWLRAANISVERLAVTQAPWNGTLRMRGRTGVYYQPAKSFIGNDSFAFEVVGRIGGELKSTSVRVRVSVK